MKYSAMYSSPIKLEALLRRRKTNLTSWVRDCGISTYSSLVERCERMGVVPPSQESFDRIIPPATVNNPTEGFIVLESLPEEPSTVEVVTDQVTTAAIVQSIPGKKKRRG